MFERSRKGENALLIQPHVRGPVDEGALEEFADLARSAGARIAAQIDARIDRPNPATLVGSGKLDEVKAACDATGADLVLVNHPLSPVQERNLEKALQRRVVDRTGLILDIFSQRARSAEGKLQVELAQLRHMATRLVRGWTHLERQRGGSIGLRGPGETQLETDRRLLQKRVTTLQKRLEKVEIQHTQMRRARVRSEMPRVALVGYTNAGKSTLFNALTGAQAYADDRLFATLDPTVRRLALPTGNAMLADTVGFVRDLPHELVAAFRSTLSEAREADLLLHVIDAADPLRDERIEQVDAVLEEIGAGDIPQLLVYNKIDKVGVDKVGTDAGLGDGNSDADMLDPSTPALRAYAQGERSPDNLEPVRTEPFDSAQDRLGEAKSKDPQSTKNSAVRPEPFDSGSAYAQDRLREAQSKDSTTTPQPAIQPRHDKPGNGFDGSHAGAARERVWLSARDGTGLDLLRDALGQRLGLRRIQGELHLPNDAGRLRAQLHELGAVRDERHDEDGWCLTLDLAEADAARLATQGDSTQLRALLTTRPPL